MTGHSSDDNAHMSVREQAAQWFVRLHGGDVPVADRGRYLLWLKSSPTHVAEMLHLCRVHALLSPASSRSFDDEYYFEAQLERAARSYPLDTAELVRQARAELAARPSWHLARLFRNVRKLWTLPSAGARSYSWRALAAVSILAVSTLFAVLTPTIWTGGEMQTGAGEWRYLSLADGSLVTLGPRSELRLDVGDARRVVHLHHGDAYFVVAKDPQRPFIVSAELARIQATGTQFAVLRQKSDITVTVKEGRVAVSSRRESMADRQQGATDLLRLEAGQQLKISSGFPAVVKRVDAERELSWVHKRLTFDGDTLADAVAEFNRLNRVQIVVDETLAGQPVHGMFDADDPTSFAHAISRIPQVVLKAGPDSLRLEARVANARER